MNDAIQLRSSLHTVTCLTLISPVNGGQISLGNYPTLRKFYYCIVPDQGLWLFPDSGAQGRRGVLVTIGGPDKWHERDAGKKKKPPPKKAAVYFCVAVPSYLWLMAHVGGLYHSCALGAGQSLNTKAPMMGRCHAKLPSNQQAPKQICSACGSKRITGIIDSLASGNSIYPVQTC